MIRRSRRQERGKSGLAPRGIAYLIFGNADNPVIDYARSSNLLYYIYGKMDPVPASDHCMGGCGAISACVTNKWWVFEVSHNAESRERYGENLFHLFSAG